ncbi:MAG: exodeoxyribonuclease VII large subunit [Eubacteriales bacterium]
MKPIEISQVNSYIKRILQTDPMLSNIAVVGEISNLKFHSSGNIYFSLKDEKCKLNCFLGSENFKNLNFQLEEGMKVIASGSIFVYEVLGNYSLNVKFLELAGIGNLAVEFEKLKKKLEKEGLFNHKFKKELPKFPKTIGVVTSSTGAAVHDIVKSIKSVNSYVDIIIFPVPVNNAAASFEISAMIDFINTSYSNVEIIIVGRGGGSMEELWAFNEERVARSIFNSKIPVISAVGHETDFTICDFVADIRAATPTAAALLAIPDTFQMAVQLDEYAERLGKKMLNIIRFYQLKLSGKSFESQKRALILKIHYFEEKLLQKKLILFDLVRQYFNKLDNLIENNRLLLESISPESMFKKGYSIVLDEKGKLVGSDSTVHLRENISIVQALRVLKCEIIEIGERGMGNEK